MEISVEIKDIEGEVVHYKLNDDEANTTVEDSIGSHDGVATQNTEDMSADGKINKALSFNGIDDIVEVAHSNDFTFISESFSLSFWFYLNNTSNGQAFLSKGGYQTDGWNLFFNESNDRLIFHTYQAGETQTTESNPVSSGKFYHCVVVRSGADVTIYLNGEDETLNKGDHIDPVASTDPLYFGRRGWADHYLNGKLDDVRIYDRALEESEVLRLYNSNRGTEKTISDITNEISLESITKKDFLNEQKDLFSFILKNSNFIPEINQEIELKIDDTTEFGGVVTRVGKEIVAGEMVIYSVEASDYSVYLDRKLVLERFDDETVDDIIDSIVSDYTSGFTTTNVDCDIEIKTMVFNRVTMSDCLKKLADAVGYSWYVDYDKDIHFFKKNTNPAPFSITDTNGNYIQNTLTIEDDLSQLRNVVTIRGADERGDERTETYVGDGDQKTFPLINKFAQMPTVEIDSVAKTVGTDYLTEEDDADCFWNYNEKYIRFKDSTIPADGEKIEITGIPLFPIIVQRMDPASVATYGEYHFFKKDNNIKSRDEALEYAKVELQAYSEGVVEGGFETDTSGLRSGQVINVNSVKLGVDEDFLIQSVDFRVLAKDRGMWVIKLATLRTMGIIDILQDLLRAKDIRDFDPDSMLTLLQFADSCGATDEIGTPQTFTTKDYVYADKVDPDDQEGYYNLSTYDD